MKENLKSFTYKERRIIKTLYKSGYSPLRIASIIKLTLYEVLFILKRYIPEFNIKDYLNYTNITDNKILIISDTHIGSELENLDYVREAYHFANSHDIHTVIHGGDIIQSTLSGVKKEYEVEDKQIEHLIESYPYYADIKTYITLGNHDFNTFIRTDLYQRMVNARDDFDVIGVKRAYLTWLGNQLAILHPVRKYRIDIPDIKPDLYLKGHTHKLSTNPDSIYLPSLSDDMLTNENAHPGFLTGTIEDDELTINSYTFKNGLKNDGPVLTKRLK